MTVQECNYSDSWWCSHCCSTYYKHDMLYHCENGKKCIYNELMQYIYDLCGNCWHALKQQVNEKICLSLRQTIRRRLWRSLQILEECIIKANEDKDDETKKLDQM